MEIAANVGAEQGNLTQVEPKIVAAITAALSAGGYLHPGDRVVDIKKTKQKMDAWKYSWLMEITMGSDFIK